MAARILIGVTGSIAAYKSAELIRKLREAGLEVRVMMTTSAQEFISAMTLAVLSGHSVYTDTFDKINPMIHIELARWAELILIAPASADMLARLAHGNANDLISTVCLASKAPLLLAPAMNQQMWHHPAVQKNLCVLEENKVKILPTQFGPQACGDIGFGRMLEPEQILSHVQHYASKKIFKGERILITAGPTQESIDPVRYLSNHSSGKMGYALAEACQNAGAEVVLISGPTSISTPSVNKLIPIITAEEMYQAVMAEIDSCLWFISTAAVADFKIKQLHPHKIKKKPEDLCLEFVPTKDILKEVGLRNKTAFLVGFAAETEELLTNAQQKLIKKNCDVIIANPIHKNGPFNKDSNQVVILQKNAEPIEIKELPKSALAKQLCEILYTIWLGKSPHTLGSGS